MLNITENESILAYIKLHGYIFASLGTDDAYCNKHSADCPMKRKIDGTCAGIGSNVRVCSNPLLVSGEGNIAFLTRHGILGQ